MQQDRIRVLEDALRGIVDAYEASAELHTSAADCAASLYDRATAALAASQPAPHVQPGAPVVLPYTNWKGETALRTIIPRSIRWGSTEWHPEPQWLLTAFDVDKDAERDFAIKDFGKPAQPVAVKVKPLEWSAPNKLGASMAYDPLLERQAVSMDPERYDKQRSEYIIDALNVQPITVQDAARLPEIAALIEAAKVLHTNAVATKARTIGGVCGQTIDCMLRSTFHQASIYDLDALSDALRAIAEGRA